MRSSAVLSSFVCLVFALPLAAQVGLNGVEAGLGTVTLGPVNTNILNGGNGELGIQYYPGNGMTYVSRRGTGTLTTAPHSLLIIDQTGALVGTVQQGPGATGGAWGHRDGATDGYAGGTKLFFGDDFGIHCYEMSSGTPVYATGAQTVMAANGPQTCSFPLAVQALTGGITRALEYDPNGNGGNGSFWSCNFAGPLVQFSLAGTLLTSFPSTTNAPAWSAYGLALNLQTNKLWVNSSPAGSATVVASVAELDPATGIFTGRKIRPVGTSGAGTSPWVYAAQGGLCYIQGRVGPSYAPANTPPYSELGVFVQGTPDYLAFHRLDLYAGFSSELESSLQISLNGAPFSSANATFSAGTTFSLQYATPASNPGSPALLLANIGSPGTPIPNGNTFNLPEFLSLGNLSTPNALSAGVFALTLGDGFLLGGLAAPEFLIASPVTQPSIPSPALPLPSFGGPLTELTFQALYLTPTAQLIATNFITLTEL
jgi:hypothetical protein